MTDDDRASEHTGDPAGDLELELPWDDQPAGTPQLAPGVRWSDILAEIDRDYDQLDEAA